MGNITANQTGIFLQNAPAPAPPALASRKSQRLAITQSGIILTASELRAVSDFVPTILTFYVWPFLFDGISGNVLGAVLPAATNAPWLWSVHYRQSYSAFIASAIQVPTVDAGAPADAATLCDSICPVGSFIGESIGEADTINTLGWRLRVSSILGAPGAVALVDYWMSRSTQ